MNPEVSELVALSELATPGPWLYRHKSDSWHRAPDPDTPYPYGESIMDKDNDYRSLKPEDIKFVTALVNWFRANASNLGGFTACDMTTASAEGFRAGVASVGEDARDAASDAQVVAAQEAYWRVCECTTSKRGMKAAIDAALAQPSEVGGAL